MNGVISPEIERAWSSRPARLTGKAETQGPTSVRTVRCFRGSYPRHAIEGFRANKGDPVSSSGACKVEQAYKARTTWWLTGSQTGWYYSAVGRAHYTGKRPAEV